MNKRGQSGLVAAFIGILVAVIVGVLSVVDSAGTLGSCDTSYNYNNCECFLDRNDKNNR